VRRAGEGLKALIPLNGRPFIDYVVDSLLCAGLRELCLVIAPEAEPMRRHAARISRAAGVRVECAVQEQPRGTADAVLAAERFVGGDEFVLVNGDNLFPVDVLAELAGAEKPGAWAVLFPRRELLRGGNIGEDRVGAFAVARVSDAGELLEIVEKPSSPEELARGGKVLVSMNLYRFTADVFDACRRVEPDPERGELELTSAVAELSRSGRSALGVIIGHGPVFDLTRRADIPAVERALQDRELCF
jgi:glucose-1-phosphate thymidylyltransferase